jgi:transcriptional regulator with XRE-family HTH domain
MTKRGLTQERVAELMGCSQQTVSGWLRAAFVPTSAEHLVRLRDLFGIPPEAWLTTAQRRSLKRASGGVPAIAA